MKIFIETERLLLREIIEADASEIFDLDSDPEVMKYLGGGPENTMSQAVKTVEYIRQQYVDNGIGRWAVIDKATNEFMGWSGLKYEKGVRGDLKYYDLGYRLKRKYWGKGIATETAIASLKYGFNQMNLEKICAAADCNNTGSNNVLRKVGLQFVDVFEFDGIPHNWYELEKKEWLTFA